MAIDFPGLFRVKSFNGVIKTDWGTIQMNPNFDKLPHAITIDPERNQNNRRQITIPINKFAFWSIKNDSTGEVIPNLVLRRKNSDYMKMVEERSERENYSLSLNSINVYYDYLNNMYAYFGGLWGFSDDASSSSANGRSISSTDDDVHRRPQCDVCFKFNNALNGSRQTLPFHLCPNDVVVRDFRSTAGPIAPPSKLRRRH